MPTSTQSKEGGGGGRGPAVMGMELDACSAHGAGAKLLHARNPGHCRLWLAGAASHQEAGGRTRDSAAGVACAEIAMAYSLDFHVCKSRTAAITTTWLWSCSGGCSGCKDEQARCHSWDAFSKQLGASSQTKDLTRASSSCAGINTVCHSFDRLWDLLYKRCFSLLCFARSFRASVRLGASTPTEPPGAFRFAR